jgi:hypothetical protein
VTWERGRARVEQLLRDGELEAVVASAELAGRLLDEAGHHLRAAELVRELDPTGAYQLAYDAARKGSAALLAAQGLRSTTRGGHVAVQDTVREQFGGQNGVPAFDAFARLRRKRAATEYPDLGTPSTTTDDVDDALRAASAIVAAARQLHDAGHLGPFGPRR